MLVRLIGFIFHIFSIHVNAAGWCCYTYYGHSLSDELATCLYKAARHRRRRPRPEIRFLHPQIHLRRLRTYRKRIYGLTPQPRLPGIRRKQKSHHRPPRGRHHRLHPAKGQRTTVIPPHPIPPPRHQTVSRLFVIWSQYF